MFYGATDPRYASEYPQNFNQLKETYREKSTNEVLKETLRFLHFVGIKIRLSAVQNHLTAYPDDLDKFMRKAYYTLKHLAHPNNIDLKRPFTDNSNDIYFLLLIESGRSLTGVQTTIFETIEIPEMHKRKFVIPEDYLDDPEVSQIFDALENTNDSYYIHGKAGTGKSTFIHYFVQNTKKKTLVFAFTGIAALNASGQTIHSFFILPVRAILPEDSEISIFHKASARRKIIEDVEVIIIDEISMLRADVLEAIDYSLRKNGGDPKKPFGGKQMVFVGDIFQLPPVTDDKDELERVLFIEFYNNPYFFSSPAYARLSPKEFHFKKVHRQTDRRFIELLDKVRLGNITDEDITTINSRYHTHHSVEPGEFRILLTSTNKLANTENNTRLEELKTSKYIFKAIIEGEFRVDKFPTQTDLVLAQGAQVMFIINDREKNWVNGTIARIDFLTNEFIEVSLPDGRVMKVYRHTWENTRYSYDRVNRKIVSEVIGRFTQYPLRLAWAVTIHKSQGLTFDKVTIDLGQRGAFVTGQTYTALSRCRSLEGINLRTPIKKEDIIIDERLINFHTSKN